MSLNFEDKMDELDVIAERNFFDEVDLKLERIRKIKDKVVEIRMCSGYTYDVNDPLFGELCVRISETKRRHQNEINDLIQEAKLIAAREIKKIIK